MLTVEQRAQREGRLSASQVGALMSGDETKLLNLWKLHVGDPTYVEPELRDVWPVRLGEATELLNIEWFSRKFGPVSRQGEVVLKDDWMCCTLDAWSDEHRCAVECKHVGGREPLETIIARYSPQTHWQMIVTESKQCALSVIMGANEPIVEFLQLDSGYADELLKRAKAFMRCVETLTPPVVIAPVQAPVPATKTYDFTGNNSWAANASTWITTRQAAADFKAAEKEIKAAVPSDAQKCSGHGINVLRNRAGSLTIKETA